MERPIEEVVPVEADPERVVEVLGNDPASVLTGTPSADPSAFLAEMAVPLGGGARLVHKVDVAFHRLPDAGAIGRFHVAWRPRDHRRALPVFEGALTVHRDGAGSCLRLAGHYSLSLGAVGALGDRLLGHRVAASSVRAFLEAAAARIAAVITREDDGASAAGTRTVDITVTAGDVRSELYLG